MFLLLLLILCFQLPLIDSNICVCLKYEIAMFYIRQILYKICFLHTVVSWGYCMDILFNVSIDTHNFYVISLWLQ